jgi:hypothetical protein
MTDGSISAAGTEMRFYYGRPILKEPVWKSQVPAYFFTGGLAGGCSLLHGFARVTRQERLAKTALYVGAASDTVSAGLLIADLGRPERFLNMFRVFKVTSPMSVGSWVLLVSTAASNTAAALELFGILKPLKWGASALAFVSGGPLTTYTGTLIADTAIPVWNEARRELPWLFGAGACASAGAATALVLPRALAGPSRRLALLGAASELACVEAMQRRLGFVGEVYKQGQAGRLARLSKALTVAGAGLLARGGSRSRAAAIGGSAMLLAGGLAMRWSVFKAGFQSAADPRYTVIPQRERVQQRAG